MDYLYFDFVWLAVDADYHVAAFTTAGSGPIPEPVLVMGWEVSGEVEEKVLDLLPIRGSGQSNGGSAPSFQALAARGLFVYDWSDVHATSVSKLNQYQRICVPTSPLTASDLPFELQDAAWSVELHEVRFADSPWLDPRPHVPCMDRPA